MTVSTALAFSGGKDSWACLWLNRHRLDEIAVVWVDTGKNYPEILASVALAKSICPIFVTVEVDRETQIARNGLPADVVPVNWTSVGQAVTTQKAVTLQPYLSCCLDNIGFPLLDFCKREGVTSLIRGQRLDEATKGTSRNGTVVEGVTFLHPIEDWSAEEVLAFNALHMELPGHFKFKHTSMDCYDCTAWLADTKDIKVYAEAKHPELFAEYKQKKDALDAALIESLKEIL